MCVKLDNSKVLIPSTNKLLFRFDNIGGRKLGGKVNKKIKLSSFLGK